MKIKKLLTLFILFIIIAMSSITAKTMTVRILAQVPERITFEQTDTTFEVNTNMSNVSYDFIDSTGASTDPSNASSLVICAL